ncbi:MAG: class I adenylate-forming enzyme family protein [Alphaproteobacteria bacterium]|nr:class I adenylate-forming enzyme family protein [Alphaproteobacteria bacterium]
MNIAEILSEHARDRARHPAIEDGERVVTYGLLDSLVDAAAANLHAAGIQPGDIVAVLLEDSADHLIILCALARAGAVIFSLNSNASKVELETSLASVAVKAVITSGQRLPHREVLWLTAPDICQPAAQTFVGNSAGDDDPVMLIQSSGTTGAPKTFLRSHADVVAWIERYAHGHGWRADERCLSLTRMSFNVGRNVSLGMLRLGATVVVNRSRTHDELAALVRDKRISYLKLTPVDLIPLLDYAADKAPLFPGLRAMVVGSAPTTHVQRLLARERLTANCYEQLGSNEAGLMALALPEDQDAYPDAVGRIVEGVEAQIVDDEDRPLPAGEVGQVRFRGAGYPTRYLDDAQATARAFRGGWFYPGDLAALNEEGYLFFKGRADDVINNGGAKFYPIEVEIALLAHPDVREAAVFGWPHTRFGEVAVACVVTNSRISIQDLQTFCKQRLAGYKVPEIIEVKGELPRNAMGKILKRELEDTIERTVVERQAKR